MEDSQENEIKKQIYGICRKLSGMKPPIRLESPKTDETIRYWLPEIPIELISRYKKEYLEENKQER